MFLDYLEDFSYSSETLAEVDVSSNAVVNLGYRGIKALMKNQLHFGFRCSPACLQAHFTTILAHKQLGAHNNWRGCPEGSWLVPSKQVLMCPGSWKLPFQLLFRASWRGCALVYWIVTCRLLKKPVKVPMGFFYLLDHKKDSFSFPLNHLICCSSLGLHAQVTCWDKGWFPGRWKFGFLRGMCQRLE